ncbi:MAG: tetratricopeptide repeat protein [Saprospiraceae bacterium]|nr:tetratricopeptide repeat protein [Saprospiraceae bacterium]
MEKATLAAEWEKYQQQLQQNPLHLPSLIAMADLLFDNGKAELAVPYYQKITELQPDYPKAWYRLGRILLDQQPEAATPTLEKALRLIPTAQKKDRLRVQLLLAKAYRQQKQSAQARKLLENILRQYPEYPEAINLLAQLEQTQGNTEQAYKLFQQLTTTTPPTRRKHHYNFSYCM